MTSRTASSFRWFRAATTAPAWDSPWHRRFIQQHDGIIEVDSRPGRTDFRILIPAAMKPIWIVDDDRSIRWVLEKALARENLPCKAFGVRPGRAGRTRARQPAGADFRHPHARDERHRAAACGQAQASGAAGDRDDRVLGSRKRGVGIPGRRVRVPAEAVRRRQGGRTDPACGRRERARVERGRGPRRSARRSSARRRRCRTCSARSAASASRT